MSPNVSSHDFVWTTYNNQTGFDSTLYVCIIGVLMSMYGISGYEGGATMAEETTHASKSAPRGIMKAIFISIVIGFIFIVGLLYAA
jgi:amino acid transporter